LTIRVENELKAKIALKAREDRRSLADETAYLMEIGLRLMERLPDPITKEVAGQSYGLLPGSIPANQTAGIKAAV
jgi:hypothetical protein